MDFYQTGKTHGVKQLTMDRLTESVRFGDLLAYTAIGSLAMQFEQPPDRISQAQYTCGFTEGYLLSAIGFMACPNCGAHGTLTVHG